MLEMFPVQGWCNVFLNVVLLLNHELSQEEIVCWPGCVCPHSCINVRGGGIEIDYQQIICIWLN